MLTMIIRSLNTKGEVSFCHALASPLKPLGLISTKVGLNHPFFTFEVVSDYPSALQNY